MRKIIKSSKSASIIQYITIMVFIIGVLAIAIILAQLGNRLLTSDIQNTEAFNALAIASLGTSVVLTAFIGPLALVMAMILGSIGIITLILSTIALILNLRNPSLKKWKIARILNLICIIIITFCLTVVYNVGIINVILLAIIIFNVYIMFFKKQKDLETTQETEDL